MSWRRDGYELFVRGRGQNTEIRYVLVDELLKDVEWISTKKEADEAIRECCKLFDDPLNRFRLVSLEPPREDES